MNRPLRALALTSILGVFSFAAVPATANTSPVTHTALEPSFATPLTRLFRQLFIAISSDSNKLAQPLFFPRAAYVTMKTGEIPNPSGDYQKRLVAFYNLDIRAYHERLAGRPRAHFMSVNANPKLASWIVPGICENRIGYWHVPGVRLVFRRGNRTMSVGVASLISWRGVWYVVHLGPNPRPHNVGTVDDFAIGPGVAGPGGGC